jgi:hypothetical protein
MSIRATASEDITNFNRSWLQAWSARDISGVLSFYHQDVRYRDPATPDGLYGHADISRHLTEIFAKSTMTYKPVRIWMTDDGYFGVWTGTESGQEGQRFVRGLDYCVLKDGLIIQNDVYIHALNRPPEFPSF